jgi:hypothetical protein
VVVLVLGDDIDGITWGDSVTEIVELAADDVWMNRVKCCAIEEESG